MIFHAGDGMIDFDKLAQRVIRPVVETIGMDWYGWHGFRRGIASNLYELGANEKIVQRILRHAKPHVTKDRYIKGLRSSSPGSDAANASDGGRAGAESSSSPADELRQAC